MQAFSELELRASQAGAVKAYRPWDLKAPRISYPEELLVVLLVMVVPDSETIPDDTSFVIVGVDVSRDMPRYRCACVAMREAACCAASWGGGHGGGEEGWLTTGEALRPAESQEIWLVPLATKQVRLALLYNLCCSPPSSYSNPGLVTELDDRPQWLSLQNLP